MTQADGNPLVTAEELAEVKTIEVESLDAFAKLLFGWHNREVQRLVALLEVPEGAAFQTNEGPSTPLTGEYRLGFIMGLRVALGALGTLPFLAVKDAANEPKH